jgi:catechol 2,3-dioxygenase-like lactoylglutathione lyase family enzyme
VIDAEGIDFVVIPTRDRERAVLFYGGTLGLTRNLGADERFPEFRAGDATLMIVEIEEFGHEFRPLPPGGRGCLSPLSAGALA